MPRSSFFIDAEWKRWIAENTLMGAPPEELVRLLMENRFDEAHSRLEVEACRSHPYIVAGAALNKKLQKSAWVLHTTRMLREAHTPELVELSEGTVTTLHHDMTNNLMAQVVGHKRIKLIAPDYLPFLYNHFYCYSQVDPENVDSARFPLFDKVKVFEVDLGPGDVLFIPIGWWHHVRSLDPSITITATNFKGINCFAEHYPK